MELLASGKPLERVVAKGKIVIWRANETLRLKMVSSAVPDALKPGGYIGSISWLDLIAAIESIELRRDLALP